MTAIGFVDRYFEEGYHKGMNPHTYQRAGLLKILAMRNCSRSQTIVDKLKTECALQGGATLR